MSNPATPLRRARWLDALVGDTRFALRYFARHKGTTAIILAVITLATGANAMIFSTFQAEFLRPAPAVPANDSHVRIYARERPTRDAGWQPREFSGREYTQLTEHRDVFQSVAGWVTDTVVLKGDDSTGARNLVAQFVTPNYFSVLGLRLAVGSGLRQASDGAADMSAVMSYAIAEQLYGSAPAALGRRIRVNEIPVQVVGVAPPRFQGAVRHMNEPALWMPVSARADISRLAPRWLDAEPALSLFARLAPSASRERATQVARQIVGSSLPDSASRVGMSRTAGVIGLQALARGY
jgi:putative ABC transport system permease protein